MAKFDEKDFQKKLKKNIKKKIKNSGKVRIQTKGSGGFYFLGFIGAVVYFVSHATSFWDGVLGVLKAIIWPVFLVFEAFVHLLG